MRVRQRVARLLAFVSSLRVGTLLSGRGRSCDDLLGLEDTPETVDTRRWRDAASDGLKKVREASSTGLDAARESGGEALGSVRSATSRLAERVAERRQRTSEPDDDNG